MKKSPTRFIRRVDNKFTSASLDLNFQNMTPSSFDSRITFTRASNATYFDGSGILQTASTNVPRLDHSPTTRLPLGLLIEEQRTNSIRNNTMQGAVAPSTIPTNWQSNVGGLTLGVVGTGTENGITYIDIRFSGTPTQTFANVRFESNTQVVAANGQTWTSSFYCRIVAGSTTNIGTVEDRIQYRDSGGTAIQEAALDFISTVSVSSLSAARRNFTLTSTSASTAFLSNSISLSTTVGAAIDITLRIGLPQLEQGAFATSVIPTTTAAATRNADVASMTGTNFSSWYNAAEGTLYSEAVGVNNISGATRRYAEISDGTTSERFIFGYSAVAPLVTRLLVTDSTTQADVNVSTGLSGTPLIKMASVYKVNDFQQASNGTLGTADTSGTLPTVNRIVLGSDPLSTANTIINGHIRRIAYYPVRLSNDQLQALTR